MFTFCSLLGAQSESSASQSLLELDGGVKVLVDVGWDETFDVGKLRELEKQVPTLSLILLTHATVAHLAAYAHCCKHFPLFTRIPVYATLPVISLGRTLLQDLYASTPIASTIIPSTALSEGSYSYSQATEGAEDPHILLQPPTADEIAGYFNLINTLKYSQPHQPIPSPFSPPLNGLTITAYNAGHTLGGTIWHIQHGLESIVYAVDWNQARENVLAGAAWLGGAGAGGAEVIEQLRKPTALICSSRGGERLALPGGRGKRDEMMINMIKSAVSKGGIVLIPTDSSARVLELAYLLEHAWRTEAKDDDSPLRTSKLYLASKNIGATMRYTRSMLEWMDDSIVREFEANTGVQQKKSGEQDNKNVSGAGPFDFRHLRLLERRGQIDRVLNETDNLGRSVGKVILASDTSLEWGFSREVLKKISDDSRNLVILTERQGTDGVRSGLGSTLWSWWEERKSGVVLEPVKGGDSLEQVSTGGRSIEIRHAKRVALDGQDLTVYQQWLLTQRQLQNTVQNGGASALENSADIVDDASSDSSSDSEGSDTEHQGKALNISAQMGQANRKKIGLSDEDLGINILIRRKGIYDYDVRGKKGREKMFPMAIRRKRNDEYGELIRPEDFIRADEVDEVDGQDMRGVGKFDTKDTLGKKRKWDDVPAAQDGGNKRQQINRGNRESPELPDMARGVEDDASDDDADDEVTGPSRLVYSTEMLRLNVRIAYVDFAGLHDKRSLQMLIPLIQPRKLILVSGMKEETLNLASDCRKLLAAQTGLSEGSAIDVYTPEVGVIVNASVDTNAWAVKLTDALMKRITWQNLKGLSIATVTGRLGATGQLSVDLKVEESNKKEKLLEDGSAETSTIESQALVATKEMPILDVIPMNLASATRSIAQPLQVGDLRLAELRKMMQNEGHTAEFRGEGTLLIDGSVMVRKSGTGRIQVESVGWPSATGGKENTFYVVKKTIYRSLAVVKISPSLLPASNIFKDYLCRPHTPYAFKIQQFLQIKLASFEERTFTGPLPYPIAKVIFTYATLDDPTATAQLVTFRSIAFYSQTGSRIFYTSVLEALCPPRSPAPTTPMSYYATGVNTVHGPDSGPAPPGFHPGGTGAQHPSSAYYPGMPPPGQLYGYPGQPFTTGQPQYANYPGMAGPSSANPHDHGFPGVHLQNHIGGTGLPFGYNYIFPRDHTIIHVFKTTTKPWQSTILANDTRTHVKLYVPVTTTTKELMQNLGCRNDDASKNVLYECVEKGNGQWASGMKFKGDDKDRMKKPISEWGWNSSRVGGYGKNPVVWLWCTSEGA